MNITMLNIIRKQKKKMKESAYRCRNAHIKKKLNRNKLNKALLTLCTDTIFVQVNNQLISHELSHLRYFPVGTHGYLSGALCK